MVATTATQPTKPSEPRRRSPRRPGDLIFEGTARAAGILIMVALAGVAIFLTIEGIPGLNAEAKDYKGAANFLAFVWPLVFGTLLGAVLALLIATPLSIGVALVISHFSPKRLSKPLGYVIDLLAAVPSVVYGLWGYNVLAPQLVPVYGWLTDNLGFIPFFAGPVSSTGRTMFTVGIVLAVMILPIITAMAREVFAQTPTLHEEAALALGATRWEMIRMAVFPYARSGLVSGVMLGLGRALGETMAVAMVLSATGIVSFNLVSSRNPSTIAANIALQFPESTGLAVNALVASGLVLFVITLAVNFGARAIVERTKVGSS